MILFKTLAVSLLSLSIFAQANSCPKWAIIPTENGLHVVVPIYDESITGADLDCDTILDSVDTDIDGDGVPNANDAFPLDSSESIDTDGDGIGNNADADDDNDGFSDIDEENAGSDPLVASDVPTVPVLEALSVNVENGSASGTEVGTVMVASGSSNPTSFTLSDESIFTIDENGIITVKETLMCEGSSMYNLTVTATNVAGTSIASNISITVIAPTLEAWTLQEGTGTSDLIYGMSSDKQGNVLTTGYTKDSNSTFNVNVMKVTASGTLLWSKSYDDDYYGIGYDTAVDSQGNIYVSGMTKGDFGDTNASCGTAYDTTVSPFLLKLDKDGNELWGRLVCSDGSGLARGVAVDADDNAYLMGNVNGSLEHLPEVDGNDGFVVMFDSNGVRQFVTQLATDESDFPGAIVASTDGHVYVAGHTKGTLGASSAGDYDVFVSKLDNNGTIVWTTQYGTSTTDKDVAIATDDNGTLYITGKTKGNFEGVNQGSYDVFMTKMDTDGNILFTKVYGTEEIDAGEDIVVAKNGNIFIGASINIDPAVGSTHSDIGILEISPNGTLFSFDINGTSTKDYVYGIAASKCGSVYVGGYTRGDLDGNTHSGGLNDRFIKHITSGAENNHTEPDTDGDGILDYIDPDDDNDGFSDIDEIAGGSDPLDANSIPNVAPVAVEDNVTVAEDSLATPILVLLNDTDINGDTLGITSVTTPSNGGTAVAVFGKIIYTPLPDFSGIETFDYIVNDGSLDGNSVTVTVTVTPSDDAPVAVDDNVTVFVTSGTPTATPIDVLANDTDADGDTLNVTAIGPRSNGGSASYISIPTVKKILYTPAAGFTGTETFEYTISDGTSESNATVTVEVVQMIVPALVSTIVEENLTDFTMVGEDWVVDTTTFESGPDSWASNIAGQDSTTTCMQKLIESNGTLTFDYRTSTENIYDEFKFYLDSTGTSTFEDSGVSGFWTASTHNISTAPTTVQWCYVKDTSDAGGDDMVWVDNIKLTSNNPFAYSIDENSSVGTVVGDIQIVSNANAPIESFTVMGAGNADFAIDSNGEITVASSLDTSVQDTYELNVTASNAAGNSNTVNIVITVNLSNDAPVITTTALASATEEVEYTYNPAATDANSDTITWSLSDEPTGMSIDANTGVITWTPAAGVTTSGAVTLTATDDGIPSKSTTETFTITVLVAGEIMHNGFVYEEVTSPETGAIWLDRNLGASQVCTSNDDADCHGGYYQWGRGHDGHQEINADTTSTRLSIGDISNKFYESFGISGIEWLHVGEDDNGSIRISEWSSTDGSSVCPTGFSVPTVAQFMAETAVTDKDTGFTSFLKLPAAGFKHSANYDGVEYAAPDDYYEGDYWTIEIAGGSQTTSSKSIYLYNNKIEQISFRAYGYSVRCIKQ